MRFSVPENFRAQIYWPKIQKFLHNIDWLKNQSSIKEEYIEEIISIILTKLSEEIDSIILPSFVKDFNDYKPYLLGESSQDLYKSYFVLDGEVTNQFKNFWSRYPKIDSIVDSYLNSQFNFIKEIINNYSKDIKLNLPDLGKIIELSFSGSDLHNGGKQVVELKCELGSLMYKARSLLVDSLVFEFIKELDLEDNIVRISHKCPKLFDFGDHGWQEFISNSECEDLQEVSMFWKRAGSLLAILDTLNYNDGHFENIRVYKGFPVPIDLETAFNSFEAISEEDKFVERSILFTGLVQKIPDESTSMGYVAAFQTPPFGRVELLRPRALKDSTDEIEVQYQWLVHEYNGCCPIFEGNPIMIHDYIDYFIDGYQKTMERIYSYEEKILKLSSWWNSLANCKARQILRRTLYYQALIRQSLISGDYLDLNKELEQSDIHGYEEIVGYEISQILKLNVPYFFHYPNKDQLFTGEGVPLNVNCDGNSYNEIKNNLKKNLVYMNRQIDILKNILQYTPKPGQHIVQ